MRVVQIAAHILACAQAPQSVSVLLQPHPLSFPFIVFDFSTSRQAVVSNVRGNRPLDLTYCGPCELPVNYLNMYFEQSPKLLQVIISTVAGVAPEVVFKGPVLPPLVT